ncbi:MAG: glycosyltransferase [Gemmatimonadetes bacterium]|nr:glycosyltransferase [Gemmatimonadota bacterium]
MGCGLRTTTGKLRGAGETLKLLDLTEFYSPKGGGVRTYLTAKAQWLQGQPDIDHVVVIPSDSDAVERWYDSIVYRVSGPSVPASPGYHFLIAPRKIRGIVERERPDIVEVGSPYLAPWLARYANRRVSARLVGFFHMDLRGIVVHHVLRSAPKAVSRGAGRVFGTYLRHVYGPYESTIAASGAAERALREIGVERVRLVPLGVDTELFTPSRRDPEWRARAGVRDRQVVGLYVGRLATEKGLETILAALPRLHDATGLKMVFVGEGHLREEFRRFARAHPDLLAVLPYADDRGELARAYASSDLYFAPFPHETFGLSAVEALASGLPIVGVAAGGMLDLLQGTDWSRTYGPGDPVALGKAAEELIERSLPSLGKRARAHAVATFSWDRTFEKMFDIYRKLCR